MGREVRGVRQQMYVKTFRLCRSEKIVKIVILLKNPSESFDGAQDERIRD